MRRTREGGDDDDGGGDAGRGGAARGGRGRDDDDDDDDDEDVWTRRTRGCENERVVRRGASDVTSGRGVEGWEETSREGDGGATVAGASRVRRARGDVRRVVGNRRG